MSTNGGPDWALTFAEFHGRHRDVKAKKLVFTAIFNASMDAFIMCPEVPLVWRVLAWIWRHSWGNSSDFCVDKIGGKPQGQQDCADEFGVAKQRVQDCVSLLRELYFVLPPVRHMLYPVDDPALYRSQKSEEKANQSPDPSGQAFPFSSPFEEYCAEWKVRDIADFQELESAEATVNRIKIVRLGKYKEWLRGRSNHAQTIKPNIQPINKEKQSSSSSEVVVVVLAAKAEEEEPSPYQKFKTAYPADHFDEAKTKPFFDNRTREQQLYILERLAVYLTCDRWKDEDGRWIPLASNWLPACDADPPPVMKKKEQPAAKPGFAESIRAEAQRRFNKYGAI